MSEQQQKVIVIGLDCATPQLVFDAYKKDLPNISRLMEQGTWGELKSTVPPITVPAWAAMTTGKDAGELGIYGFRSRTAGSDYGAMDIAHAGMVKERRVWDILGDAGKKVGMLGVPQTYPITKPVNGMMVTSFLTPSTEAEFTYPKELREEILAAAAPDDYMFDFANRSSDEPPENILKEIYKMTNQRQKIFLDWVNNKEWDFLMMVEMGVDRIHHYLWQYMDPTHKDYVPGNPYEQQIRDYYKHIDTWIGEVQAAAPKDTIFYVVSDHGAKRMEGMFVMNQWLADNGYLTFKTKPETPTAIEQCEVDWSKTKAWCWGGFYGRLFVNVEGREPQGVVPAEELDEFLENLRCELRGVKGPKGESLEHKIVLPHEVYTTMNGDTPDMLIFWGDLYWKIAGTVGYTGWYIDHDDRGTDYGVHDWNGIFIKYNPQARGRGKQEGLDILDMTPTLLHDFGMPVPSELKGKIIE